MKTINILFICKHNKFRSKYAEAIFKKLNKNTNFKVKSAGLIKGGPQDIIQKNVGKKLGITIKGQSQWLSVKLLKWSDIIIIVADNVPPYLFKEYKKYNQKLIVWRIPDAKTNTEKEIQGIIITIQKRVKHFIKELK